MLAVALFSAAGPVRMMPSPQAAAVLIGARLAAKLLLAEGHKRLARPNDHGAAPLAGLFTPAALPPRMGIARPVLGAPVASALVAAEFSGLDPVGADLKLCTALDA